MDAVRVQLRGTEFAFGADGERKGGCTNRVLSFNVIDEHDRNRDWWASSISSV